MPTCTRLLCRRSASLVLVLALLLPVPAQAQGLPPGPATKPIGCKTLTVAPGQPWVGTGIQLKRGDSYSVQAEGQLERISDGFKWGPGGYYHLGFAAFGLHSRVGSGKVVDLNVRASGTADQDGELQFSTAYTYEPSPEHAKSVKGSFTVHLLAPCSTSPASPPPAAPAPVVTGGCTDQADVQIQDLLALGRRTVAAMPDTQRREWLSAFLSRNASDPDRLSRAIMAIHNEVEAAAWQSASEAEQAGIDAEEARAWQEAMESTRYYSLKANQLLARVALPIAGAAQAAQAALTFTAQAVLTQGVELATAEKVTWQQLLAFAAALASLIQQLEAPSPPQLPPGEAPPPEPSVPAGDAPTAGSATGSTDLVVAPPQVPAPASCPPPLPAVPQPPVPTGGGVEVQVPFSNQDLTDSMNRLQQIRNYLDQHPDEKEHIYINLEYERLNQAKLDGQLVPGDSGDIFTTKSGSGPAGYIRGNTQSIRIRQEHVNVVPGENTRVDAIKGVLVDQHGVETPLTDYRDRVVLLDGPGAEHKAYYIDDEGQLSEGIPADKLERWSDGTGDYRPL